ncbi:basal cell adhesion molecule-like [Apostichopus japonicus]|uniref:basal cell adhesion molecule-like n=1 Tax=Stichopus japonicus TaxID=307972 RepID=UPI003AB7436B
MALLKRFLLVVRICLWCLTATSQAQMFVQHPMPLTVMRGAEASFSCETDDLATGQTIDWFFGQDIQISSGNINVQIMNTENKFTLTLNSAQIIDSRVYYCAVVNGAGIILERSLSARLDVQYLPGGNEPTCKGGGTIVEGELTTILCDSSKGNPIVILAWTRSDGESINNGGDVMFQINDEGRTEISYPFNITRNDLDVTFTCTSTSEAFQDYQATCDLTFNVLYPPDDPIVELVEGPSDQGNLTCQSTGNPPPELRWSVQGDSNYTVTFQENSIMWNTSQSCNILTLAVCTVNNSEGLSMRTWTICDPRDEEQTTTVKVYTKVEETQRSFNTRPTMVIPDNTYFTTIIIILAVCCSMLVLVLVVLVISVAMWNKCRQEDVTTKSASRGSSRDRRVGGVEDEDNEGYTSSVGGSVAARSIEDEDYDKVGYTSSVRGSMASISHEEKDSEHAYSKTIHYIA